MIAPGLSLARQLLLVLATVASAGAAAEDFHRFSFGTGVFDDDPKTVTPFEGYTEDGKGHGRFEATWGDKPPVIFDINYLNEQSHRPFKDPSVVGLYAQTPSIQSRPVLLLSFDQYVNGITFDWVQGTAPDMSVRGLIALCPQDVFTRPCETQLAYKDANLFTDPDALGGHFEMSILPTRRLALYLVRGMPPDAPLDYGLFGIANLGVSVAAPIPEPGTYVLMLGGLVLIGLATRRSVQREQ